MKAMLWHFALLFISMSLSTSDSVVRLFLSRLALMTKSAHKHTYEAQGSSVTGNIHYF